MLGTVRRLAGRIDAAVDSRHAVLVAAALAALLRLPGLTRPLRPDEAGFLLVARSWAPRPDSLYGPYFVDRPPVLIALFRVVDDLGGPLTLRLVGAAACALTVVLTAAVGSRIAGYRGGRWAAVAVAALTTNPLIDVVAVKGELLGLPLVMGGILCALLALEHRSLRWAAAAGLVSMTATGMKQNLVGGLVFGAVLLLSAWATHRIHRWDVLRLATAAAVGAAVPVLAVVAWARLEGVRLQTLSYAVLGFRTDASEALARGDSSAPLERALILAAAAAGAGLLLIIVGFLVHLRGEWRDNPVITLAAGALLLVDGSLLVASGSYWSDYLFALVPVAALAVALLSRRTTRRGSRMRTVITASAVSALVSLVVWTSMELAGLHHYTEADTGAAVARAAEPGDTLTVLGGRADLQWASGLPSPYPQLWSLPMRTLDPDYADLRALLAGPDAPTWFVGWVPFGAWGNPAGPALERTVEQHYVRAGTGCEDRPVWLRRGTSRPDVLPRCH